MRTNTETDLWEAIKLDDEKAFSILFQRYSSRIYSSSYSYIKDQAACEQIVHDVFLTIWTNRKTLEIRSVNAYLTSAARYRAYKHIAANKIIPISYEEDLENFSTNNDVNKGYNNIAYLELEAELNSHLKSLPKRCHEIFIMSRRQLLSNAEIALKLGISKRSVENQITQALKHLRASLKDIFLLVLLIEMARNIPIT